MNSGSVSSICKFSINTKDLRDLKSFNKPGCNEATSQGLLTKQVARDLVIDEILKNENGNSLDHEIENVIKELFKNQSRFFKRSITDSGYYILIAYYLKHRIRDSNKQPISNNEESKVGTTTLQSIFNINDFKNWLISQKINISYSEKDVVTISDSNYDSYVRKSVISRVLKDPWFVGKVNSFLKRVKNTNSVVSDCTPLKVFNSNGNGNGNGNGNVEVVDSSAIVGIIKNYKRPLFTKTEGNFSFTSKNVIIKGEYRFFKDQNLVHFYVPNLNENTVVTINLNEFTITTVALDGNKNKVLIPSEQIKSIKCDNMVDVAKKSTDNSALTGMDFKLDTTPRFIVSSKNSDAVSYKSLSNIDTSHKVAQDQTNQLDESIIERLKELDNYIVRECFKRLTGQDIDDINNKQSKEQYNEGFITDYISKIRDNWEKVLHTLEKQPDKNSINDKLNNFIVAVSKTLYSLPDKILQKKLKDSDCKYKIENGEIVISLENIDVDKKQDLLNSLDNVNSKIIQINIDDLVDVIQLQHGLIDHINLYFGRNTQKYINDSMHKVGTNLHEYQKEIIFDIYGFANKIDDYKETKNGIDPNSDAYKNVAGFLGEEFAWNMFRQSFDNFLTDNQFRIEKNKTEKGHFFDEDFNEFVRSSDGNYIVVHLLYNYMFDLLNQIITTYNSKDGTTNDNKKDNKDKKDYVIKFTRRGYRRIIHIVTLINHITTKKESSALKLDKFKKIDGKLSTWSATKKFVGGVTDLIKQKNENDSAKDYMNKIYKYIDKYYFKILKTNQ